MVMQLLLFEALPYVTHSLAFNRNKQDDTIIVSQVVKDRPKYLKRSCSPYTLRAYKSGLTPATLQQ
jgi:hypothetical protein